MSLGLGASRACPCSSALVKRNKASLFGLSVVDKMFTLREERLGATASSFRVLEAALLRLIERLGWTPVASRLRGSCVH